MVAFVFLRREWWFFLFPTTNVARRSILSSYSQTNKHGCNPPASSSISGYQSKTWSTKRLATVNANNPFPSRSHQKCFLPLKQKSDYTNSTWLTKNDKKQKESSFCAVNKRRIKTARLINGRWRGWSPTQVFLLAYHPSSSWEAQPSRKHLSGADHEIWFAGGRLVSDDPPISPTAETLPGNWMCP